MKRIAYVVDSKLPSKEANSVHAVKMAKALSEYGEVTLFCKELLCGPAEALTSYGVEKTFDIIGTNNNWLSGKFKILLDGWMTSKKINKNGPFDMIYGRSAAAIYFSRQYAPFIFESHEWPTSKAMYLLQKKMLSSSNCKGLVTITGELKKKYLKEFDFLKNEDITVLQDASDRITIFPAPQKIDNRKSSSPNVVIGYLGHLYPGKCMEIIIEIAKLRPNYLFHVAGGTDEMVKYWTSELHRKNICNVILYGYVDNKDVGKWYSAFDIFLLPLKNNIIVGNGKKDIGKWISPLKLFEAMAYGKAIISSDLPTLREVITDGQDALIVSPEKAKEWADALDRLVAEPALRKCLGFSAKKKLENQYTWSKRAKEIMGLF